MKARSSGTAEDARRRPRCAKNSSLVTGIDVRVRELALTIGSGSTPTQMVSSPAAPSDMPLRIPISR